MDYNLKWIIALQKYASWSQGLVVGFTRIAVNFKFHSWFANFKLT